MIHRVHIEKIIPGGFGLARQADGPVVLTRYVLPGETVLVRETGRHRGYIEALPVEVIDASPERLAPPCPWFTSCGGCDLQHIDAAGQHRLKTEIVRESLNRAKVFADRGVMRALLPSPLPYRYRFRIRLKIDPEGKIGFYRAGSNSLVLIRQCLLATGKINRALTELLTSDFLKKKAAGIHEIELMHSPADDHLFAVLHLHGKVKMAEEQFAAFATSLHTINAVFIKKGKKIQPVAAGAPPPVLGQEFSSSACGRPFSLSWSPACFFQVNARHNQNLIDLVCRLHRQTGGKKILDLFCGMGNFSIPIALTGAEVTGIEQNPESIRWAELNARKSGISGCRMLTGDVGRLLRAFCSQSARFETILLDPPRQGLGNNTPFLARLEPQWIIYVSCDPATLARDLAILTGNGYTLRSLTPVDMFPQTHHVESVALLEKN